jgi:hypothetical protein
MLASLTATEITTDYWQYRDKFTPTEGLLKLYNQVYSCCYLYYVMSQLTAGDLVQKESTLTRINWHNSFYVTMYKLVQHMQTAVANHQQVNKYITNSTLLSLITCSAQLC